MGRSDGCIDGRDVGGKRLVGLDVGCIDGDVVGCTDGQESGCDDGCIVG